MSNIATSTPVINAVAAAVVSHDTTAMVSNGGVNLQALGVPSTVTAATQATSAATNNSDFELLTGMEQQRVSWENNELAASNRRLYSILTQAYSYYWELKLNSNEVVRKQKKTALDNFVSERGYTFMPSTHDMTRVVKCGIPPR